MPSNLQKGSLQELEVARSWAFPGDSMEMCLQRWVLALLLRSTNLTSLYISCDGIAWRPVLGLLSLQHLEIATFSHETCLAILADLSSCQCLETHNFQPEERGGHRMVSRGGVHPTTRVFTSLHDHAEVAL